MLKSAELFQRQAKSLIPNYNLDLVINTDQTGCSYRADIKRTLTKKGEKTVQVANGSMS